jgi:hypothetical protein
MYVMHIFITVKRISEGRGGMEDQDIIMFYLQRSVPGHVILQFGDKFVLTVRNKLKLSMNHFFSLKLSAIFESFKNLNY